MTSTKNIFVFTTDTIKEALNPILEGFNPVSILLIKMHRTINRYRGGSRGTIWQHISRQSLLIFANLLFICLSWISQLLIVMHIAYIKTHEMGIEEPFNINDIMFNKCRKSILDHIKCYSTNVFHFFTQHYTITAFTWGCSQLDVHLMWRQYNYIYEFNTCWLTD